METLPKGTTQEQWDRYYADLKEHEEYFEKIKPQSLGVGASIEQEQDYRHRLLDWERAYFMDAPNKPGYYRANND